MFFEITRRMKKKINEILYDIINVNNEISLFVRTYTKIILLWKIFFKKYFKTFQRKLRSRCPISSKLPTYPILSTLIQTLQSEKNSCHINSLWILIHMSNFFSIFGLCTLTRNTKYYNVLARIKSKNRLSCSFC